MADFDESSDASEHELPIWPDTASEDEGGLSSLWPPLRTGILVRHEIPLLGEIGEPWEMRGCAPESTAMHDIADGLPVGTRPVGPTPRAGVDSSQEKASLSQRPIADEDFAAVEVVPAPQSHPKITAAPLGHDGVVSNSRGSTTALRLREGTTTVMIRNIPKNVTQQSLIRELNSSGYADLFDFCYAPIESLQSRQPSGFAFVNFVSPEVAMKFAQDWHHVRRFGAPHNASRLDVSRAVVQGREANLAAASSGRLRRLKNPMFKPFVASLPTKEYHSPLHLAPRQPGVDQTMAQPHAEKVVVTAPCSHGAQAAMVGRAASGTARGAARCSASKAPSLVKVDARIQALGDEVEAKSLPFASAVRSHSAVVGFHTGVQQQQQQQQQQKSAIRWRGRVTVARMGRATVEAGPSD
mmetsp:Transcript_23464/g.58359  ORF Transcript_23464/g.58359 Transcript_23464/m.58359 type:complete len:411 (-) Transcript_23464:301-1533(-)|eukprot:CAMPEP_0115188040 /NCGR_PEP_ID=MMETSP0270-20121206/10801_1 /TAXON_ID=71861 /ORGANISM="Scrippsiella trochoidea, Strain CCMP3099" /LENGTH=410 /DNA_ID=CAMNT_0002601201 /DNA_START=44 /DNA_END=1276 /DNA_ORIENTATION=-